jgi:glutathione S-transferase
MSKLTLKYWGGRGLMEVPRLMLAMAGKFPGADYTDARFSDASAAGDLDANLGRMPVAEVVAADGTVTVIGQSAAINHYVASENGLLGASALEAAQILAISEHIRELGLAYSKVVPYGATPTDAELDDFFTNAEAADATGVADRTKADKRQLLWFMGRLERLVGGAGFAVGGKLSLADALIFNKFGDSLAESETLAPLPQHRREAMGSAARMAAALAKHPKLSAIVQAVGKHPNVAKWMATRGPQGF